jgi:Holliday junction resolvase RusA-like endonuclease
MGDGAGDLAPSGIPASLLEPAPPLIFFTVPGKPVGKARPRFSRRGGVWTPSETIAQEERVRQAWAAAGSPDIPGLVQIVLAFSFVRPASHFKKTGDLNTIGLAAVPGGHRDWDNLAKLVTDALNGLAFEDDRLICRAVVMKYWGGSEYTEVTIRPWSLRYGGPSA